MNSPFALRKFDGVETAPVAGFTFTLSCANAESARIEKAATRKVYLMDRMDLVDMILGDDRPYLGVRGCVEVIAADDARSGFGVGAGLKLEPLQSGIGEANSGQQADG